MRLGGGTYRFCPSVNCPIVYCGGGEAFTREDQKEATVGAVGAEELGRSASPLQAAAARVPVPDMVEVVGAGAITAMLGVLLSQVFGISRMAYAMARKGDLPRGLDRVHPGHAVPDRAVLLAGAVIVLVALFGTLGWVVAAATLTILVYYTITNIAALRMPRENKLYPDWVAALGLTFCIVLAASQRPPTIVAGVVLLLIGFALRLVIRRGAPAAAAVRS